MNGQRQASFTSMKTLLMIATAVFIFQLGTQAALSNAAAVQTANSVSDRISYQGYLTDDAGEPLDSTVTLTFGIYAAESRGRPFWQETQTDVLVNGGHFNVMLGSVNPLEAAVFADPVRYLQVGVDSGDGVINLPRQRLTAVPYAFQAETAAGVPWDGLTSVPAGFADGIDNGASYANRVVVAKSGGDFSSVQAAIDSITTASGESPYLVWVAPGTYSEAVTMKPFVHLQGAGEGVTVISSDIASEPDGSVRPATPTAATVQLASNSTLRDLTVVNTGTDEFHVALWADDGNEEVVIENVTTRAVGSSGINIAIALNGSRSNMTLKNVTALSENGLDTNIGLSVYEAIVTLRGGTFTGRGGSSFAHAIQNLRGATLVAESVIAHAELAIGYGLLNEASKATLHSGSFTGGEAGIFNGGTEFGIPSTLLAESVVATGIYGMTNNGTATLHGGSFTSNLADGSGVGIDNSGTLQANHVFAMAEGNGARALVSSGETAVYGGAFIGRGAIEARGIIGEGLTVSHAFVEGGIVATDDNPTGGGSSVSHTRLVDGVAGGSITCTAVSQDTRFFAADCP